MSKYTFLFILVLSMAFIGCVKQLDDPQDYFPKVKIISVIPQLDGSLNITAKIIHPGASDVESVGMFISDEAELTKYEGQKMGSLSGDKFTINYASYENEYGSEYELNMNRTYYVRAFAANDYGYSYSPIFEISPWILPQTESPCTPELNTASFNSTIFQDATITGPFYSFGQPTYTLNSFLTEVDFTFGDTLQAGTYSTVYTWEGIEAGEVMIEFGSIHVLAGQLVYVEEISPHQFEVTLCEAATTFSSFILTTRFNCTD